MFHLWDASARLRTLALNVGYERSSLYYFTDELFKEMYEEMNRDDPATSYLSTHCIDVPADLTNNQFC